jgi:hypothetical protein
VGSSWQGVKLAWGVGYLRISALSAICTAVDDTVGTFQGLQSGLCFTWAVHGGTLAPTHPPKSIHAHSTTGGHATALLGMLLPCSTCSTCSLLKCGHSSPPKGLHAMGLGNLGSLCVGQAEAVRVAKAGLMAWSSSMLFASKH